LHLIDEQEFPDDALHIAIASTTGMDYIVTRNFSHINNPFTICRIRHTVEEGGYICPETVSPEAFLGE
jgi:predicted ABC-type ATPase